MKEFGFHVPVKKLLEENRVFRIGVPPFRLEIVTTIDGVDFAECYEKRRRATLDETEIDIINLHDLRVNRKASGRAKDLADLENLPEA